MTRLPDALERESDVELVGRDVERWVRRLGLLAIVGVLAAALAGVFGQTATKATDSGPAAALEVEAPSAVRGGLMFQARFVIDARAAIERPVLVLEDGWVDGFTVNSLEPAPVDEVQRNGYLLFGFEALEKGDSLTIVVQLQVNPTTSGSRSQTTILNDGPRELVRVDRSLTVYP